MRFTRIEFEPTKWKLVDIGPTSIAEELAARAVFNLREGEGYSWVEMVLSSLGLPVPMIPGFSNAGICARALGFWGARSPSALQKEICNSKVR